MSRPRFSPLPIALALVALALIAAAWTTRSTVTGAYSAVRDGQALAAQQAVRADLAELAGPPTSSELAAILEERRSDGLRYLAITEGRRVVAEAGQAAGTLGDERRPLRGVARGTPVIQQMGDRVRVELPAAFPRAWGGRNRLARLIVESESSQAADLRAAASRTLAIGALAALVLLGIAGWLVRGELRRRSREQERERERRLASLGEMSAVLAHEIRNPLASLKGNAQLLAASLPEGEKPRAKAERVVDEAVRLERLTQDLLAFVRTGELAKARVAIASVVRDAASAVNGEITVEVTEGEAFLDSARMHQTLVNLLENAVAAGPPVNVVARCASGRLEIDVIDHGPGVPVENRDKVFEPFFTAKTRGTGLGLAIARRVVELHRGTLTVDDAPGGGAPLSHQHPGEVNGADPRRR